MNDDLLFVSPENKIPTDFYYASLASWVEGLADVGFQLPFCCSPEHDWDASGNGLYGVHSLDGTDPDATQLSVGRVPAKDSQDAGIFCFKILTYEDAGTHLAEIDPGWPAMCYSRPLTRRGQPMSTAPTPPRLGRINSTFPEIAARCCKSPTGPRHRGTT